MVKNEMEIIEELKALFRQYSGGEKNDYEKRTVFSMLHRLDKRFPVGHEAVKLDELKELIDVFFSSRKHLRYPGGLEQVRGWVFQNLGSLQSCLEEEEVEKE